MRECRYYQQLDDGRVECMLCPHHCHIANGKTGICKSRRNMDGKLISEVYGKPCSLAIDPIEKKPLYHFHPGTECLSIACTGCNFHCRNCQNHEISQVSPTAVRHYELTPQQIVALCLDHHCPGIAYTYTEPLTYMEYIVDTAQLAHENGLWNILVTAGYVCREPLKDLLPYLDAANIDLKSFSDDIYQRISGGHLQPVLDTILAMRDAGVWIELTNLIIPGINGRNSESHQVGLRSTSGRLLPQGRKNGRVVTDEAIGNDDMNMIREMCQWLVSHGLADNPLHFSRFFPRYQMQDIPPTPIHTLKEAKQVALDEGIRYVYLGNV